MDDERKRLSRAVSGVISKSIFTKRSTSFSARIGENVDGTKEKDKMGEVVLAVQSSDGSWDSRSETSEGTDFDLVGNRGVNTLCAVKYITTLTDTLTEYCDASCHSVETVLKFGLVVAEAGVVEDTLVPVDNIYVRDV